LEFVSPKFSQYKAFSEKTREVFQTFDPDFESGSMDEAYLDITDYMRVHGMSSVECAHAIRGLVHSRTGGLTCSVGIAPNKLIAKICSDINKPDGVFSVPHDVHAIREFMNALETRKIPGIGRVSSKLLNSVLEIRVCEDILQKAGEIKALFSEKSYDFFVTSALGIGSTLHRDTDDDPVAGRKSKSVERTFTPTASISELSEKLVHISQILEDDLKAEGLHGKTLTLKIKLSTFAVKTKATTMAHFTNNKSDMYACALHMLKTEMPAGIRLMGLRMSNFLEEQEQRDPCQPTLQDILSSGPKKINTAQVDVKINRQNEWDCASCTYKNSAEERFCAMCLTSRKTGVRPGHGADTTQSEGYKRKKTSKNNMIRRFFVSKEK
jgi:DNA polymerase kappa